MERCEQYLEWISAYIDGELGASEQTELRRHLEACPACKRALVDYRTVSLVLSDTEAAPPVGFVGGVMSHIETKLTCRADVRPRRSMLHRTLAVAAVFAAVAAVGFATLWENPGNVDAVPALLGAEPLSEQPTELQLDAELDRPIVAEEEVLRAAENELYGAEDGTESNIAGFEFDSSDILWAADTSLFDLAMTGEYQSWPELAEALDAAGYVYVSEWDGFRVADPYNPGSYLHARVSDDPALAGEHLLLTFSFQWAGEERTVRIHVQDGEMTYYYGAPTGHYGLGTRARNVRSLREFILFGER